MKLGKKNSRAFTLIELLVVVSIISLLISIIVPSLNRARFLAKRVVCFNNVKSQFLPQMMYAETNKGKFAPHYDYSPMYFRSRQSYDKLYLHKAMKDAYITDSKILLCPLQKSFGFGWSDLTWIDKNSYGGWDSIMTAQTKEPALCIFTGYMWFANYKSHYQSDVVFEFDAPGVGRVKEPAWPQTTSQCSARKAFIAHDLTYTPGIGIWDHGHGGQVDNLAGKDASAFKTRDNPVGYADGHVETSTKSNIKPRAQLPWYYNQIIYY